MKRLTTDKVGLIKASNGIYAAADVARAFDVHRSNVLRIWNGEQHREVPPAAEPPNIQTRTSAAELQEDIRILLNRGMSATEVANTLGISRSSVYAFKGVFC